MKASLPRYPFVVVTFEDHAGDGAADWKPMQRVKESNETAFLVCAAGWLVAESRERITIASHIGLESKHSEEQACGDMTIARALIRKIRRVKLKG